MNNTAPTPTLTQTYVSEYQPLTSESRVRDFEIPPALILGEELVSIPESMRRKDVHFLLDENGKPIRAAWIHKGLAHILNAFRMTTPDIRRSELERALEAVEDEISSLVKNDLLKNRGGPGAMALVQANENVAEDCIVISWRTYQALCQHNRRWIETRTVMAERFPNLGPETTRVLKLVINHAPSYDATPATSIFHRAPGLAQLFPELLEESRGCLENTHGICDAFYLHPRTLKDSFEGDGDGDQIFIRARGRGRPQHKKIDMIRQPLPLDEVMDKSELAFDILERKANKTERGPIEQWLPPLMDDLPIAAATYMIRLMWYTRLEKYQDTPHPAHFAWKEVAPMAIKIVEFVMDIRKGDWTPEEMEAKVTQINNARLAIREMQEMGNPFACTVTSARVLDVQAFIQSFPTLQSYLNEITGQKYVSNLSTLDGF